MMNIRRLLTVLIILFLLVSTSFAQEANLALANEELTVLAEDLNYGDSDIDNPIVTDYYTSNGITHIYYQQSVNQIGIYGATASVHLKNNEVFAANLNFLKGIDKRDIKQQFQVQALEAVVRLAIAQNYPLSQTEILILEADEENPSKPTTISESGISNRAIPLKLVFFENDQQELQLAWSIFIDEKGDGDYKNFIVNATTGSIEKEINLTISCNFDHDHSSHHPNSTNHRLGNILSNHKAAESIEKIQVNNSYTVYPIPIESPNHGIRSVEVSPWLANPTASPNGWHKIGATNYTTTRGNNVDAYDDSDNTNSPANGDSDRVDGGTNLAFNNPLDLNGNPSNNKPAAITNLFYWNNIIHDVWFNYGFDEASGNFQEENYTAQGNGSDYVYAEAQDGSGTCNANMSTPGDGGNPRMQMYLCNGRDGDFDNGVVVHEYGHGISIRLAGGPSNSSCLNNQEQMGEGWSDWYGMVMTIQPGDTATKSRPMGTWLFGQGATGSGIRPYPYNTDMSINPMTYGTLPQSNISVPHGVGSVWATMLWDLTWAMIDEYGWDADLYNGTGGNNKTMALVLEGLKLQPCNPGFVDGRDGILKADSLLNGGANSLLIWETFARRGLGYSADQGSTGSKSDGVEAFDLPSYFTITFDKTADKETAQLGEPITYTLTATNQQTTPLNNLVFTDYLPDNLEFVSATDGGQANGQTVTWPQINLGVAQSATRTVVAKVKEDLQSVPSAFDDDLESGSTNWEVITDNGLATWTLQTNNYASSSTAYHCPSNPSESITNLVTTTALGITAQTELIFQHSYDIESGTYSNGQLFGWDGGFVEISIDDGATWTDLGNDMTTNGYNATLYYGDRPAYVGNSNGWIETKVDLSAYANQMAKIRFQMRYDYSVSNDGWYIDDIQFTNLGLSAINQAQISNGTVTNTTLVDNPTEIEFTPYNSAPITMEDYATVDENSTNNTIDVQANDSDPNAPTDFLTTSIFTQPMNGSAILNGNNIDYTPTADYFGLDTIIYQVCDMGNLCEIEMVFLTVLPVNQAPVTDADFVVIDENTTNHLIDVQGNDSDPDAPGDTLITTILEAPLHGSAIVVNDNSIDYTPTTDYFGMDKIVYQVCDTSNACASDTVFITINHVNLAPVTDADYITINKNVQNALIDVQSNDYDPNGVGDILETYILKGAFHGVASVMNGDSLNYTPSTDYSGQDTIVYEVCDTLGLCSADTVFINISEALLCEAGDLVKNENGISDGIYVAGNSITSAGVISNNDKVGFMAGNVITLLPGFHAEAGVNFIAYIDECASGNNLQETPANQLKLAVNTPIINNTLSVHPNPFNHQAIINYQLANSSQLWIGLHDITGKLVKVIEQQGDRTKGTYQVILNSETLNGGAYWLTMRTNKEIITKKVFLVKN